MLVLLDIDGVMVSAKSWSSPPLLNDGFYAFNSRAVSALNTIITTCRARILLTTSHKSHFDVEKWIDIFEKRGVIVNGLERLPNNDDHRSRLDEITNWHTNNRHIKDFVIIDDDKSLNSLPGFLKDRLIQTSPLIGLNESHVQEALSIFKKRLEHV